MSNGDTTKTTSKALDHDWERFDSMSGARRHAAALSDPDAQPLSPDDFKRMKRTPQVKIIRRALGLSQEEFSARFHIPLGTLRDWEQGRKAPDAAARAYLVVIGRYPQGVRDALRAAPAGGGRKMSRPSKGVHLYLRRRRGRNPSWVIRDGSHEIGTGCARGEHGEAEKRLSAYLAAKHRPDFGDGDPSRIPVADILLLYADERAPLTRRPALAAYTMTPLAAWWGDKMVSDVTADRCRDYAAWRTSQPVANFKAVERARTVTASTARRELGLLAAALGYAFREGKLKCPVPVALPPKGPARMRWLTRSEAAQLLWAAWRAGNRHVARFILVALYTGSRHGAVVGLRWVPSVDAGWVDLDQGLIYRRGAGESESSKRRPPVPVSPRLVAHFRRWKAGGGIYVISWGGLPIAKMRRAWHTARRAAGLGPEVVPHVLRHTFASWAVQAGHSFAKVAAALGTTERIVEQTYGHLSPDRLRDVVASVSGKAR